jgi:hypothetical protein
VTLNITIDVNGQVLDRIQVVNANPKMLTKHHLYEVTEVQYREDGSVHSHTYRRHVLHRRRDGALHLAAKVCEFLSYERRKRT